MKAVIPTLQKQVSRDFAPPWGVNADLALVAKDVTPPAGNWWLVVLDNSDQAGALGYHDVTEDGQPLGKIFAKSDIDNGLKWSVTASHELLEMLGDPAINLTVFIQPDATSGTLYAYEVCDACEADEFAFDIDGVTVSDFVYPSWFETFRKAGTQFDYQKLIKKPLELLRGGYIGVFDVATGTGWHQVTMQGQPLRYDMQPRPGSRRERRRTPQDQWMVSAVQRHAKTRKKAS